MPERQLSGDQLMMKGFGERLRWVREAYAHRYGAEHHSRVQWARRLWVSPAMYGRWEGGTHLPKMQDLLRMSVLFRVDPNYFVAGVLSRALAPWLHRALKAANPRLLDEGDWWRSRTEAFVQANQAPADAAAERAKRVASGTTPKPSDGAANGKQSTKQSRRVSSRGTKKRPFRLIANPTLPASD